MKLIITIFIVFFNSIAYARNAGETEITTDSGIEVFKKEKYYLLKKNVVIKSDDFELSADLVKAYFEKDLYDITRIDSKGNVKLKSTKDIEALGEKIDFDIINELIVIKGKDSYLDAKKVIMKSDELIEVNNLTGNFNLSGLNSNLKTETIYISGTSIKGNFIDVDGENVVSELFVVDENQSYIKTNKLDLYSLEANYSKKNNIIELFEKVKILRDNESIIGDYAKINTLDESYKVESKNTEKKVKVLLKKTNE